MTPESFLSLALTATEIAAEIIKYTRQVNPSELPKCKPVLTTVRIFNIEIQRIYHYYKKRDLEKIEIIEIFPDGKVRKISVDKGITENLFKE